MAEWRDILDRAADNLSIDPRSQASFRQQPAMRQGSFIASRNLLAHELEAASYPAQAPAQMRHPQHRERAMAVPGRASITQSIGLPVQAAPQAAAKKGGAARELATLSISVGIVAMAVYGFFVLLH